MIVVDSFNATKEIPLKEERITSVPKLLFYVLYKCKNENDCSLRGEYDNSAVNLFSFDFIYNGYFCDHQNPETPIKRGPSYKLFLFTIGDRFDYIFFDWKIIKYKEEKSFSGMLRSTKETYGGELIDSQRLSIPSETFPKYEKKK